MRLSGTKATSIHQYRGLGNQLWDLGGSRPSLDLNFAYTKNLVDGVTGKALVTFTRASSATYIDSAGVLQTAATDVPRFDHDPVTRASLGLLVEEPRTNSIRNNTMVGAVAGTPGTLPTNWSDGNTAGLTREIVSLGTENGVSYVDIRYSGTANTSTLLFISLETTTSIAAANGQTWAFSVWVKSINSTAPSTSLVASQRDAAGAFLADLSNSVAITSSLTRVTAAFTINNASTAFVTPRIGFTVASGTAYNFTLRIGMPQLEQGAFATSVIPTTTATVTRSADVASISGSNFSSWYRQDEGTVFASAFRATTPSSAVWFAVVSDGTLSNRIQFGYGDSNGNYAALVNNAVTGSANPAISSTTRNAGFSYGSSGGVSYNAASTTAISFTSIPAVNQISIGCYVGNASGFLSGTIKRLTYWPQRLPNSTLQTITQ